MMKKFSSLLTVALAVSGIAGVATEANASTIIAGSTINITGAIQFDDTRFGGGIGNPPFNGDVLFCDIGSTLPGTMPPAQSDTCYSVGSGQRANTVVTSSTDSFASILAGVQPDAILSFNPLPSVAPGTPNLKLLELPGYDFFLDKTTLDIILEDGTQGNYTISAEGTVVETGTGSSTLVKVDFTGVSANGLLDDGSLGDDVTAGDLFTGVGSYSGTIVAQSRAVPESSTVLGLSLLVGSSLFLRRNKKS